MHDLQRLMKMRELGVRWRYGRLPVYPATMTTHDKKQADRLYDAMTPEFVESIIERKLKVTYREPARAESEGV